MFDLTGHLKSEVRPLNVMVEQLEVNARCDRCCARAMYRASFLNGVLYFCGHHFHKNKHSLDLQAIDVEPQEVLS